MQIGEKVRLKQLRVKKAIDASNELISSLANGELTVYESLQAILSEGIGGDSLLRWFKREDLALAAPEIEDLVMKWEGSLPLESAQEAQAREDLIHHLRICLDLLSDDEYSLFCHQPSEN